MTTLTLKTLERKTLSEVFRCVGVKWYPHAAHIAVEFVSRVAGVDIDNNTFAGLVAMSLPTKNDGAIHRWKFAGDITYSSRQNFFTLFFSRVEPSIGVLSELGDASQGPICWSGRRLQFVFLDEKEEEVVEITAFVN